MLSLMDTVTGDDAALHSPHTTGVFVPALLRQSSLSIPLPVRQPR
jgi:hypothetical protein